MIARLTVLSLLCTAPLAAQNPLGIFNDVEGEWAGEAWIIRGPEGRHVVQQRELIKSVAGGTVVTVQGIGTEQAEDGTTRTVHDAFAVIHLDHDGSTPLMRAFTAEGNWMDMELSLQENGYDWAMDDPRAGRISYEMRFDEAGRWVEKGFIDRNGEAIQFFEMTLEKVEP